MRYVITPKGSRLWPWAVVDSESSNTSPVSCHMTAAEARAVCHRLNLEAAAPDLLAALEVVAAMAAHDRGDDHPAIVQARTAIAKAKGN